MFIYKIFVHTVMYGIDWYVVYQYQVYLIEQKSNPLYFSQEASSFW